MTHDTVEASLNLSAVRVHLYGLRDHLPQFTIYDSPKDWPQGMFVARLWLALPELRPTDLAFGDRSLERLQITMEALGLVKLTRSKGDDPVILETWL